MEDPAGPPTPGAPACQACGAGLMALREYFHRVKICEVCWRAPRSGPVRPRQLLLRRAVEWRVLVSSGESLCRVASRCVGIRSHLCSCCCLLLPAQTCHKADVFQLDGQLTRFCQQCATIHPLAGTLAGGRSRAAASAAPGPRRGPACPRLPAARLGRLAAPCGAPGGSWRSRRGAAAHG
jgi:hypothetical protein